MYIDKARLAITITELLLLVTIFLVEKNFSLEKEIKYQYSFKVPHNVGMILHFV